MIRALQGFIIEQSPFAADGPELLLNVNGVMYGLLTTARTLQQLATVGPEHPMTLMTSLIVREDAHILVGFIHRHERDLFDLLRSASGVGLKVALAILSDLDVPLIVQAVVTGEHKTLTAVKGVGPKLAQKIVLELKEKMTRWSSQSHALAVMDTGLVLPAKRAPEAVLNEAQAVLLSLGYTPAESQRALAACLNAPDAPSGSDLTSETVLRLSLRWLAQAVG